MVAVVAFSRGAHAATPSATLLLLHAMMLLSQMLPLRTLYQRLRSNLSTYISMIVLTHPIHAVVIIFTALVGTAARLAAAFVLIPTSTATLIGTFTHFCSLPVIAYRCVATHGNSTPTTRNGRAALTAERGRGGACVGGRWRGDGDDAPRVIVA